MKKIVCFHDNLEDIFKMTIGGKASNLIRTAQLPKISVPIGFVIPIETFESEFASQNFSEEFTKEIQDTCNKLFGTSLVAVRSSAISEDLGDKSFAGQYESVLNVSSENVIEAIISVHTAQIKMNNYFSVGKNEIAVIVQKMVEADYSGILFSRNPMNNTEAIIEYDESLADKLASGKSTGIGRLSVNREKFNRDKAIDSKVENASVFKELFEIGFELEKELNNYCDIEWAVKDFQIYILQVRPITTLGMLATFFGEKKEFDDWTKGNVQEVLPEKMTPLSWSIFGELINRLLRDSFQFLPKKYEVNTTCFIRLDENRLLYNIGAVNYFTNKILGFPTMNEVIGGNHFNNAENVDKLKLNWKKILVHLPTILKNNSMYEKLPELSEKKYEYIENISNTYQMKELELLTNDKLLYDLDQLVSIIEELMFLHTFATSASFSFVNLLNLILKNNGVDEEVIIDLLSNIEGIKILELNGKIINLVEKISKKGLQNEVAKKLQEPDWEKLFSENELQDIKLEIMSIVKEFGHRGSSELELSVPTWGEKPDFLLKAIVHHLSKDSIVFENNDERYTNALATFNHMLNKKKVVYPIAKKILIQARSYTRLRENNKHYLYLLIAQLRRMINESKKRIPIEYQEYFYMITLSELKDILQKKINIDLHQLEIRKQFLERENEQESLNKILRKDLLKGIVASAGYVKGRIRVLKSINQIDLLEENDILVTKSIDIGWLPIFQKISGLITEIGGVLSHGSIIAREYGLPTIVNIENVSDILRDGEEVILDAYQGIVYRIS